MGFKAQPIWDMKPKVPGISIPVPKKQGSNAANPSTIQPAQGAQDDLKAVAEAMMTVIQSFGQRIEKVEKVRVICAPPFKMVKSRPTRCSIAFNRLS